MPDWTAFLASNGVLALTDVDPIADVFRRYSSNLITYEALAAQSAIAYSAAMRGLAVHDVDVAAREFVAADLSLMCYSRRLLERLHPLLDVVIVSGCPAEILSAYAQVVPMDRAFGLRLTVDAGRYEGSIESNPGILTTKRLIAETCVAHTEAVLGMGDSGSDMPLLRAARLRVVVDNLALARELPDARFIISRSATESDVDAVVSDVRATLGVKT